MAEKHLKSVRIYVSLNSSVSNEERQKKINSITLSIKMTLQKLTKCT